MANEILYNKSTNHLIAVLSNSDTGAPVTGAAVTAVLVVDLEGTEVTIGPSTPLGTLTFVETSPGRYVATSPYTIVVNRNQPLLARTTAIKDGVHQFRETPVLVR